MFFNKYKPSGRFKISLVFVLLSTNQAVFSQELSLASELDMFADLSVSSATRLAQSPRDLPVSVTIITRKMIDASGAVEIPDLFRMVPGFRVTMGDGGFYSVFGHGVSDHWGRKLEVLVDGLPVQSPVLNFIDWLSLPIEISDIDYIEVMRGTSTAVYGTNAFDGVINIVTRKPFEEKGFYYNATYGDPDLQSVFLKHGFLTDNASHSFTFNTKKNSGFDNAYDNNGNKKFRYNGNYNPSINDEVDILLSFNKGFKDIDGTGDSRRTRDMDSNYQYIKWKHINSSGDDFNLKAYHYYVKYDDQYLLPFLSQIYNISSAAVPFFFGGRPDQRISFSVYTATSNRYGLDLQQSYNFENLRFVIGSGLVYDKVTSPNLFGDKREVSGFSRQVFSNTEWRMHEDYVLNAGLMIEKIEARKEEYSSRLSLNYHLNDSNTFRIGAARSYRARTVYSAGYNLVARYTSDNEIFGTVLDNQGYDKPENITTYEIAHLVNLPHYGLAMDWRIFNDKYGDVRAVVKDSSYPEDAGNGANVTINGGNYSIIGFEFQLKYTHNEDTFLVLQYSNAKSSGNIANNLNATTFEDYSNAMPKNSYGFMVATKLYSDIHLGLTYTRLGSSKWRTLGEELPSYDRVDMNLSKNFRLAKSDLKVELLAQNLLNDKYGEYRASNVFDRRLMLRLSLRY